MGTPSFLYFIEKDAELQVLCPRWHSSNRIRIWTLEVWFKNMHSLYYLSFSILSIRPLYFSAFLTPWTIIGARQFSSSFFFSHSILTTFKQIATISVHILPWSNIFKVMLLYRHHDLDLNPGPSGSNTLTLHTAKAQWDSQWSAITCYLYVSLVYAHPLFPLCGSFSIKAQWYL